MKETEANKKWCPYAISGSERPMDRIYCIASDCMMWRWEKLYENMPASGKIVENGRSGTEGYCGLAGKE